MGRKINNTRVTYTGATPGADTNTYPIFTTVTNAWPAGFAAMEGISKLVTDLKHSHLGTYKWYKSSDRGTNWLQIGEEDIGAPAATDTVFREFVIEPYADFKLDWINGNSAQTTWVYDIVLIGDRSQP